MDTKGNLLRLRNSIAIATLARDNSPTMHRGTFNHEIAQCQKILEEIETEALKRCADRAAQSLVAQGLI